MKKSGKDLRKEKLEKRDSLRTSQISEKSDKIYKTLVELDAIKTARSIFTYVSFRSEVCTIDLINNFLKDAKKVSVPITYTQEKRIEAIQIKDMKKDLAPGYCEIPEPKEELCKTSIIDPEEIDVIILPGSVFDKRGGRLGYGGGYYDRFLEKNPRAIRVGLAFDLQVIAEAPLEKHDELLDFIITEKRIIKGKRRLITLNT